ncbi:MAG: LacI family transcriptional regulator [Bifidobacteriaceae bacterium]|jgi:LacI family transcriptional regulator|nr:LacI family transcriptional regulator [Bifidobacteriaceae bacterium]
MARATRRDVAALAGTSVAVVSYVVNGGPRTVAAGTRQRVLDAIEQTGYRPNRAAAALAGGTAHTIGLIVPDVSNPFFAELAHMVEDEVFACDRVLLLGDCSNDPERERIIARNLWEHNVDGLLYVGSRPDAVLAPFLEDQVPVVLLDRVPADSAMLGVGIDHVAAARSATAHLAEHGYREIGLLAGPPDVITAEERRRGWEQALGDAGLVVDEAWVVAAEYSRRAGYAAALELLGRPRRPRAVFAANDRQALGATHAAARLGLTIPRDLALFTIDGTEDAEFAVPSISTVQQPLREIAGTGVALLLGRLPMAERRWYCEFTMAYRQSCGCEPSEPWPAQGGAKS